MQIYTVDLNELEVYEAGAFLLSLVCYPNEIDKQARAHLHDSLCRISIEKYAKDDPSWADSAQPIKPRYFLRDRALVERDWRSCLNLMKNRLIAGKMLIAFVKEVHTGEVPQLPGIKKLSIRGMAKHVLDDLKQSDAGNVATRIWRPSVPVIHLAAAIETYISEQKRKNSKVIDFGQFLFDLTAINEIVDGAEFIRELMRKNKRLKINQTKLVMLRLV